MRIGTAQVDITPPVGVMLAGDVRRRPSLGTDDPLMCKALVVEGGGTRLAIVTLDVIALERRVSDRARARLAGSVGLRPAHLLVNCSHTHSGPYTAEALDPDELVDESYLARVERAIIEAVREAAGGLRDAAAGWATVQAPGLGHNRRLLRPDGQVINSWLATEEERETLPGAGPVDETMAGLVFFGDGAHGKARPVAVLWSYTLHVNTHFGKNFSADYPGAAAAAMRGEFGDDFFSIFLSGACGDVNHRPGLRFAAVHPPISEALARLVHGARPASGDEHLAAVTREMTLPVRDREPFQEAEIRAKWPAAFDVFENEHRLLAARGAETVTTMVQAMRLGDGALACTPGEYFVQLGLDIKAGSPFTPTVVTELSNDYLGYVPTRAAYEQGGYETFRARTARVAHGAGEAIRDELLAMLGELAGGEGA